MVASTDVNTEKLSTDFFTFPYNSQYFTVGTEALTLKLTFPTTHPPVCPARPLVPGKPIRPFGPLAPGTPTSPSRKSDNTKQQ